MTLLVYGSGFLHEPRDGPLPSLGYLKQGLNINGFAVMAQHLRGAFLVALYGTAHSPPQRRPDIHLPLM